MEYSTLNEVIPLRYFGDKYKIHDIYYFKTERDDPAKVFFLTYNDRYGEIGCILYIIVKVSDKILVKRVSINYSFTTNQSIKDIWGVHRSLYTPEQLANLLVI
jgi:hypothetical protein